MLQHNYVTYTNELDPKKELQDLVGNVQGEVTALLGNPSCSFMLMNTSGEMQDYEGLSIDEMIDKLLEGGHVMYVMYEDNGLRYEMNIMFLMTPFTLSFGSMMTLTCMGMTASTKEVEYE